ncbi:mannosyl-glycoprotein endo-beta-N-acetylglucosamidase [Bacillus thuringiensis]|nr:mannosyl-glycoprotein endo-beta-N-acetylglucosamidase [Bacillus thuringiensis]
MREQPTTQGKVIGTVKKGTNVQVLSKEKEWAKISHDGKEGYVILQFLGFSNGNPNVEQKQQLTINNGQKEEGIVTATRLNVRNSPALGSSMIGYVQKNEKVTVLGKANGWAKISYQGKEGYVSLEFVKIDGNTEEIKKPEQPKTSDATIKNGTQEVGTINATSLRVRSAANTSSSILGNLKNGEKVTVLGKANGWAKISYQGKEGYVSLEFVKLEAGKQEEKPVENIKNGTQEVGTINATSLRVRSAANTSSTILGTLKNGEKVTVLGKANGWAKISYQGKEGYVSLEFVKIDGNTEEIKKPEQPKTSDATIKNGTQEVGTINATSLRVRSAANTSSSILGNLKNGEKVTVLGKANGWAKISYQGKEGYVSLEFVKLEAGKQEEKPAENITNGTQEVGTINATSLRVRSAANTSSSILGNLKNGEKVTVLGKANGWAKISYQGKEGYVSLEFVKLEAGKQEEKPAENITNGTQEVGTINATSLRVRSAANTSSSILGNLKNGEKVTVLGKANGWAKISYQGKEGYVSLEFVKLEAGKQEEKPVENIKNGTQEVGTINATSLRVRSAANTSSTILGTLKNGEKVTVLGKTNGWAKISYQGKEGYVSLEFVKLEAGKQEEKPAENITNGTQEVGTINATSLRVRSAANTSSSILGNLKNGEKVTVLGKANGWAKISYQGKEGYVSLEFVKLEAGKQEEKPAENITNGTQEVGTINATSLRVRSAANTSSSILGNLKNGEKVTVLGKANGWAKISYQGKEGYVSLEFVKLEAGKQEEKPEENITNGTREVGTINATSLRVRSAANTSSSILGNLKNGEKVTVLGKANGWAKISYQGKEGYVSLEFVKLEAGKQEEKPAEDITNGTQEVGTINATSLRVRSAANTSSTILGTLKNGEKVTVLGKANGWAKISYQGKEGYVSLEFVKLEAGKQEEKPEENITNGTQEVGTINATSLRVRSAANTSSSILGNLKNGEKVTVLGKANGWAKISYQGKEGYVSLEFITIGKDSIDPTNPTNPGQVIEERAVVNASLLNVRKGPSTGAAAVGHLKNGETVTIIGKENGWAKIHFNGGEGYVSLQFLKVKQGSSSYEIVTSSQKVQKPNEAEATQIMQNMKEDAYIKSDGKVVNMKQGFVRANGVINIYDITTGKKLTYVKGGADLKFVKAVDDRIHVQIDGMTGYVNINDVTLHPTMTGEKTSYYATKNGKLYHYVYNPENGKHATYQIGNAPKHLKEGERYEAFDKKQIGGQDSYQYFEYMPLRATSTYTGDEIDNFLRKSNAKSPLIGLGKYFVSAAEKYKMNAGYLVSHAILESGWGTSRIAQDKKNLFGFRAVDSDPYNGATGFKTWEEGIDFCAAYIDKHYLNPSGNTYNGGNLGDKAQGMNVMYASDENWGQQIASLMYRIDAMNGSKDLNKYRLGTLTAGSPIFKSMAEGQTGMTSRNIMVAIKKTVNTPQGSYYEIVSDNKEYNSVYVKAGSVNLVNSY